MAQAVLFYLATIVFNQTTASGQTASLGKTSTEQFKWLSIAFAKATAFDAILDILEYLRHQ